jgi:hypothetical protein
VRHRKSSKRSKRLKRSQLKPRLWASATEAGGLKEDQLPNGEDHAFLESDLGSDNCGRLILKCCGYKQGK